MFEISLDEWFAYFLLGISCVVAVMVGVRILFETLVRRANPKKHSHKENIHD